MSTTQASASPQEAVSSRAQVKRPVPITGVRRMIADRLAHSHRAIPGVHVFDEVDLTGADLRWLLPAVAKTVADLASRFPVFNAHVLEEEYIEFSRVDIGIAVDTSDGLVVPTVRDCAHLTTQEIGQEIARLAGLARTGSLRPRDVTPATVTITSPGKRSGTMATPLINPPQAVIVGIYRAMPRPVVLDGDVVVRTMANLSVTFDHRVIDGAQAGDYAMALARGIEKEVSSGQDAASRSGPAAGP